MGDNVGDKHLKRGNLLWEGSRMFLPEHREQLLAVRRSRREFRMPELDEEWMNEIGRAVSDSLNFGIPITIIYGTQYEAEQYTGIVKKIDPYAGWVELVSAGIEDAEDEGGQEQRIYFRRIVEIREA